jgi:hypothetical protein
MSVPIVVRGGILATNGTELPVDAFARVRTSEPRTLFQFVSTSVLPTVNALQAPVIVSRVTGSATQSLDEDGAVVVMAAGGAGGPGSVVRQTRQYISYQPGKSRLAFISAMLAATPGGHAAGAVSRVGLFDDRDPSERRFGDGHFFELDGAVLSVVERSSSASPGSSVEVRVPQSSWNADRLDGSGPSGYVLDAARMQLFWLDMEWLGVGDVRMGVVVEGRLVVAHTFKHNNALTSAYTRTPKLPVRFELSSAGPAAEMRYSGMTVLTEGGFLPRGVPQSLPADVEVAATATATARLALSLRTDGFAPRATLLPSQLDITVVDNRPVWWQLAMAVEGEAAALAYTNVSTGRSLARYNATTVSGISLANLRPFASGIVTGRGSISISLAPEEGLEGTAFAAASYAGEPDAVVLVLKRVGNQDAVAHVALGWFEIGF